MRETMNRQKMASAPWWAWADFLYHKARPAGTPRGPRPLYRAAYQDEPSLFQGVALCA